VQALQARIAEHRASLAQLDQFLDRDMAFHREIARISGNPIFPAIVEAIFRWGSDYYQPLVRAPGAEQLTLAEHQRIVDAIAAHDGPAAEEAMRAHLLRSNAMYQRIAQQQDAA
jgi:DNA-binding FadR family transcriptional regulator